MSFCLALTDVDWSLTKDAFSILGTIASALGIGLAFYVGIEGLATWKRQLRGTTHHELARKALIELYKYRESVERARSPAMMGSELELKPEEEADLTFREKSYLRKCSGYQKRFDAMFAARAPIHATLLESEALWGKELGELFKPLFSMQHDFLLYVEYWLMASDPREDEDYRRTYWDVIKDKPKIIFDKLGDDGDEFRQNFNRCVAGIEQYLKPRLA